MFRLLLSTLVIFVVAIFAAQLAAERSATAAKTAEPAPAEDESKIAEVVAVGSDQLARTSQAVLAGGPIMVKLPTMDEIAESWENFPVRIPIDPTVE